jgi:hypothetical protein
VVGRSIRHQRSVCAAKWCESAACPPVTRDADEVFDAFGYHIQMEALDETIMAFDYGGIFGVISGVKLHPPFVC